MPFNKEVARLQLTDTVNDIGNRIATMSFSAEHAWQNHWMYTDGPNNEPSLQRCKKDPQQEF